MLDVMDRFLLVDAVVYFGLLMLRRILTCPFHTTTRSPKVTRTAKTHQRAANLIFHHLLTASAASACWSAGGCEMVLAQTRKDTPLNRAPLAGGALFHTGAAG